MDTFKGQYNDEVKQLYQENNCELNIVLHSLTNMFQPLNINVNQSTKFNNISNKFDSWYASREISQLSNKIARGDIKLTLELSNLKPLHAKWNVEMQDYLMKHCETVTRSFSTAGIKEAINLIRMSLQGWRVHLTRKEQKKKQSNF